MSDSRGTPGFTLVELVTAMAVSSVLFLTLGSAVFIAVRSVPKKNDPLVSSVIAAQVLDQLAAELETAINVTDFTARTITFTVADRNADGRTERIAYSWSGVAGDPLVRTYNGSAWTALDSVTTFNLVTNIRHISEEYTNPGVEDVLASAIDDHSVLLNSGTEKLSNNASGNIGQLFTPGLSSDVIGYRPTSFRVWAQSDRIPGTFRIQAREASATLVPRTAILEDRLVNSNTLLILSLPQTYALSAVARQAPGNPLCMTVMWQSGLGPGKFATTKATTGLLRVNGAEWEADNSESLSSVLFGVPMRSGTRRTASTQYLLSVGVSLGAGASAAPVMQTSAQTLNHPELVSGLWEIAFDRDPTAIDVNGDGTSDWVITSGSGFGGGKLVDKVWTATADTIVSQPDNDFGGVTIVDLRMQAAASGATAGFSINAARVGDSVIAVSATLLLNTDGTQTLTVSRATGASTSEVLCTYNLLRAQATDLRLIIDPVAMGVAVNINGAHRGTFPVAKVTLPGSLHSATLYSTGGGAKFSYARVRVLKVMP